MKSITKPMLNKFNFSFILEWLEQTYPTPVTALVHKNPFELLIGTILAAQCTDERVNKVTAVLFKKYPDPRSFADAPVEDIEFQVKSITFYRNKSKAIKSACQMIVNIHAGNNAVRYAKSC